MHLATTLDSKINYAFNSEMDFPILSWTDVEVVQMLIESKIMLVIRINGTVVHQVENTIPQTFVNVRVYVSDKFYDPAVARIRQLKYGNLPDGEVFVL